MEELVAKYVFGELTLGELWDLITSDQMGEPILRTGRMILSVAGWSLWEGKLTLRCVAQEGALDVVLRTDHKRIRAASGELLILGAMDVALSFPESPKANLILSSLEKIPPAQ